MKGLNKKAFDLKFKSPQFLGDYKHYNFEFVGNRAKWINNFRNELKVLLSNN